MKATLTFVAAALLAVAGCTPQQTPPLSTQTQTTLLVDNQSFSDMTVYVLRGGSRVRLGLAPGAAKTSFIIPADVLVTGEAVRFVADPIGIVRASVSEQIYVHPGDQVTMQIPPT
jgi:hypothetical protein